MGAPDFLDIERMDALDAEVSASGMTKQMEKDILQHLLQDDQDEEGSESSDEQESDEDTDGSLEETEKPVVEEEVINHEPDETSAEKELEIDDTEIGSMRKEIEGEVDDLKDLHSFNKQWKPFRD